MMPSVGLTTVVYLPENCCNPYFAPQNAPGESALVARGEQNSVFPAFRYTPEQVPWLSY